MGQGASADGEIEYCQVNYNRVGRRIQSILSILPLYYLRAIVIVILSPVVLILHINSGCIKSLGRSKTWFFSGQYIDRPSEHPSP